MMSSVNKDGEVDDEELGAYIYQTSHTAKYFREKAASQSLVLASSSHQTQRKSPRLLATKSKQLDIPTTAVPEKSISNTNYIKERSGSGRVCIRHGAKKKRYECSQEGCTNHVFRGGLCIRHGAIVKRCKYDGCTNHARRGGVCRRHGANLECSHGGCTNYVVNGGVCIRHGATVKQCKGEGCTKSAINGGVCRRHGAKKYTCSKDAPIMSSKEEFVRGMGRQ